MGRGRVGHRRRRTPVRAGGGRPRVGVGVVTSLRRQILDHLLSGHTVAWVVEVTGSPRDAVTRIGEQAGLRLIRPADTFVGQADRRPVTVTALLGRADRSDRQRTRSLAARARTVLAELEREVAAEDAARYPVSRVRAWARQRGYDVPARGRYLPSDVVAAWRAAGEP